MIQDAHIDKCTSKVASNMLHVAYINKVATSKRAQRAAQCSTVAPSAPSTRTERHRRATAHELTP
eukprot:5759307-Alexandrium_andersonii.AAC.1